MRWQIGRRSDNIEDRRGMSVGRGTAVGARSARSCSLLLAVWFGVDPSVVLQGSELLSLRPRPQISDPSAIWPFHQRPASKSCLPRGSSFAGRHEWTSRRASGWMGARWPRPSGTSA